jgi:hypothetical protein
MCFKINWILQNSSTVAILLLFFFSFTILFKTRGAVAILTLFVTRSRIFFLKCCQQTVTVIWRAVAHRKSILNKEHPRGGFPALPFHVRRIPVYNNGPLPRIFRGYSQIIWSLKSTWIISWSPVPTSHLATLHVNYKVPGELMEVWKKISAYCHNHTKHVNMLCEWHVQLMNVEAGATHSNHCV